MALDVINVLECLMITCAYWYRQISWIQDIADDSQSHLFYSRKFNWVVAIYGVGLLHSCSMNLLVDTSAPKPAWQMDAEICLGDMSCLHPAL